MAILIVDDSPDQYLLLRSILSKAGHDEVLVVDSARAAFTALNVGGTCLSMKIDLILMDVLMPDIDGVAACRQIKQQAHLRDIPIIMVTAQNDLNNLREAFSARRDGLHQQTREWSGVTRPRVLGAHTEERNGLPEGTRRGASPQQ